MAAFLDAYWERCVKPAGLRSLGSVRSQIAVLKEHLGHLPVSALEEPDEINRFKTDSDYAEDVELATIHRVLERLRAAINWGLAQTPPLFARSPFHRLDSEPLAPSIARCRASPTASLGSRDRATPVRWLLR